jgi:vacuolar-type H+-ATPase subunit H
MQHKKNQMSVGLMVQRCHHWRQKRKQFMDTARTTADEIERERLLQAAEHYGRIVNEEQSKIDSKRDTPATDAPAKDDALDDDDEFQDFKNN